MSINYACLTLITHQGSRVRGRLLGPILHEIGLAKRSLLAVVQHAPPLRREFGHFAEVPLIAFDALARVRAPKLFARCLAGAAP